MFLTAVSGPGLALPIHVTVADSHPNQQKRRRGSQTVWPVTYRSCQSPKSPNACSEWPLLTQIIFGSLTCIPSFFLGCYVHFILREISQHLSQLFILTQLRIIIMPAQVTTKRPFLTRGWHKLPSVGLPWKATVVIIQGSYYWLLCLHYQCTLRSLRLLCGLTNISKKALILSIDFI